ncbi:MAG TPA: putative sulfate exporter family transporter [Terriglobales bacterium]|nr:putative sulfate exporter family transporter [Terriglobales bacterium]
MEPYCKSAFILGIAIAASSASPPIALALGLALALSLGNPFPAFTRRWSKLLLQLSVIGLGFGMNLGEVLRAGRSGFVYTIIGISFAVTMGMLLGKTLSVERTPALLISVGTAICGGSAIAAVGPVVDADEDDMAVALGTVFILNAIALFIFPLIGHALRMPQRQFGLWAALAIHDTSSVVGAAEKYGNVALSVATTVKLTRALWIVPVTIAVAMFGRRKARVQIPWFILFFLLAALVRSYSPAGVMPLYHWLLELAKIGLAVTLFLIGSALSREAIRRVGVRPLVQGVVLWLVVALGSIWLVRSAWI